MIHVFSFLNEWQIEHHTLLRLISSSDGHRFEKRQEHLQLPYLKKDIVAFIALGILIKNAISDIRLGNLLQSMLWRRRRPLLISPLDPKKIKRIESHNTTSIFLYNRRCDSRFFPSATATSFTTMTCESEAAPLKTALGIFVSIGLCLSYAPQVTLTLECMGKV